MTGEFGLDSELLRYMHTAWLAKSESMGFCTGSVSHAGGFSNGRVQSHNDYFQFPFDILNNCKDMN